MRSKRLYPLSYLCTGSANLEFGEGELKSPPLIDRSTDEAVLLTRWVKSLGGVETYRI
jgi:hypothetical protein